MLVLAGEAAGASHARERIRKQKMAEGVSKKAARQPWMGERAKKLDKAAPKGKGVSLGVKTPIRKVARKTAGSAARPAIRKQGRGARQGKPPAKAAGRKAGRR
jgi:hypothetical protein